MMRRNLLLTGIAVIVVGITLLIMLFHVTSLYIERSLMPEIQKASTWYQQLPPDQQMNVLLFSSLMTWGTVMTVYMIGAWATLTVLTLGPRPAPITASVAALKIGAVVCWPVFLLFAPLFGLLMPRPMIQLTQWRPDAPPGTISNPVRR